jgi:hypothetical protein
VSILFQLKINLLQVLHKSHKERSLSLDQVAERHIVEAALVAEVEMVAAETDRKAAVDSSLVFLETLIRKEDRLKHEPSKRIRAFVSTN